ncbi:serine hydrolase domain-containing protein [Catellatospora sp. KI3]|uniref:serine hydrolase domain-containing protein n=1 Tax=Catellatospora sp. KI3 TaxID=3041620 RepID=UPI002483282C|nr:serine hydrolase domain-containing protein [Catellatospora sp. KI3]MDI1460773.1 serine hydrolase domain-containing protein [Catellatospora sp. KI3]
MTDPKDVQSWLDSNLGRLAAERGVPGASVAVLAGGRRFAAATGVTSTTTGVPVDTDTVFQIGSITKLWTSALVMQLVDDGLVDLDQPVRAHLPEFAVGDAVAAAAITPRQLLCHTAGFEGDVFTDTGRGEDAVERYVASIGGIPQLFPAGEFFSYNNTGFVVLGRLVEVLRGLPYDEVLMRRLAAPLALPRVCPSPYEAIVHRAAVGHLTGDDGRPVPTATWALPRSNAPAGSMLAMTPGDLVGFAAMHLAGGTAADGTLILAPQTVAAMQQPQVTVPELAMMGGSWGLGWERDVYDGRTVVGHDGGTIGQAAFLRVVPDAGVAVALLTNGGDVIGLYRDVVGHLLEQLAGIVLPGPRVPPAAPVAFDAAPYLGRYADTIYDITVSRDTDGTVWLDRVPKDVLAGLEQPLRTRLVRYSPDCLISAEPHHGVHLVFAFIGRDGAGRCQYIHYGRAVARTAD